MSTTWTTNDGRVLDIRWMTSQHLVNSLNMVARKNKLSRQRIELQIARSELGSVRDEIKARQLYRWSGAMQGSADQIITTDVPREDFKTLCMLRAILDTQPKNVEEIVELFHRNPESYTEHVLTCTDPKWVPVVAKFSEYRLAPQVNP